MENQAGRGQPTAGSHFNEALPDPFDPFDKLRASRDYSLGTIKSLRSTVTPSHLAQVCGYQKLTPRCGVHI
jgi:hypothetical protein